jgi:hypothetical protein
MAFCVLPKSFFMLKRTDIHSILVIGVGPIVIGQAAQACKDLLVCLAASPG